MLRILTGLTGPLRTSLGKHKRMENSPCSHVLLSHVACGVEQTNKLTPAMLVRGRLSRRRVGRLRKLGL